MRPNLRLLAAHILDMAKRGHEVSPGVIRWALRITGDIA